MPGLPGAATRWETAGSSRRAAVRACSRPPDPMMSTRTALSIVVRVGGPNDGAPAADPPQWTLGRLGELRCEGEGGHQQYGHGEQRPQRADMVPEEPDDRRSGQERGVP